MDAIVPTAPEVDSTEIALPTITYTDRSQRTVGDLYVIESAGNGVFEPDAVVDRSDRSTSSQIEQGSILSEKDVIGINPAGTIVEVDFQPRRVGIDDGDAAFGVGFC